MLVALGDEEDEREKERGEGRSWKQMISTVAQNRMYEYASFAQKDQFTSQNVSSNLTVQEAFDVTMPVDVNPSPKTTFFYWIGGGGGGGGS